MKISSDICAWELHVSFREVDSFLNVKTKKNCQPQ